MKKLYAPWRAQYIKDVPKQKECPFCVATQSDDDATHMVIRRGTHALVMLNRYPYNAGHLLIIPYKHEGLLEKLEQEVTAEIMELSVWSVQLLKERLKCDGVNLGCNLGEVSGGSIPQHLHMHSIPRWKGDTNFLTASADTKLIGFDLNEVYQALV
jgi:ATP adenylyltransferase